MRKFVTHTIVFLIPVIMIIAGTEWLLRRIPNDYRLKRNYLVGHPKDIDLLYLGNSHAYYGLNPEWSRYKSFNAAYVSQTPREDLSIIRKFGDSLTNLRWLVVPVDCFTLYETMESGKENWRAKFYPIYYGVEDPSLKNHFEVLNGSFRNNSERWVSYYLRNISPISCNRLGWGTNHRSSDGKNLIESGMEAAKRHTLKKNETVFNQNLAALESICMWAKNKNVVLLLVMFPANKSYTSLLDSFQLNETRNTVSTLIKKYNSARFFDLLNDPRYGDEDFYDADHLNEKGALKLTQQIDSILPELTKR